jgi:hypothetical protein
MFSYRIRAPGDKTITQQPPIAPGAPPIYSSLVLSIRTCPLYLPLIRFPTSHVPFSNARNTPTSGSCLRSLRSPPESRSLPCLLRRCADILTRQPTRRRCTFVRYGPPNVPDRLSPQQLSCIVQGSTPHPFRLVRDALRSAEDFSTTSSPWSDRCEAPSTSASLSVLTTTLFLQPTREIPSLHSPNRSKSGNAYFPARTHLSPGLIMRSRSFLRGRRVHVASTRTR